MELLGKVIGVFCIAAFIPVCCRAQYRNLNDTSLLRRIFKTLSFERHASQENQQAEPESQLDYGKSRQGYRMSLSDDLGFGGHNEVARLPAQSQSHPVYRRTRQAIFEYRHGDQVADNIEDKWDSKEDRIEYTVHDDDYNDNTFDADNDDDDDDDDDGGKNDDDNDNSDSDDNDNDDDEDDYDKYDDDDYY
ncbi:uncharacterized protein LOC123536891 [Mercenaria mercenaria]|uniref:uncharacterized protein LOC123536891 n=1 Tax=Mercenaria mercenaria TaxID=6596 RepID=UPI00234F8A25|nr:uncharacterized protein LOC123536891 [Mercenaria mercenaria]